VWFPGFNGVFGRTSNFDSQVIINLSLISDMEVFLLRGYDITDVLGTWSTEDSIINIDKEDGLALVDDTLLC
jgi:hypothetical protein